MDTTTKKSLDALPEDKQREARTFWERIYETASAQKLHDHRAYVVASDETTSEIVTDTATLIADKALRRWLERW